MVTLYQSKAVAKLTEEGWKVLGPIRNSVCGAGILMENPHGGKVVIDASGTQVLVADDESVDTLPRHDLGGEG